MDGSASKRCKAPLTYQTRDGDADVPVDAEDPLVGVRLVELGLDDLLDSEDDAVLPPQRHRRPRVVDGLASVVDLEDAAVGRELRRVEVVPSADRRHRVRLGLPLNFGMEFMDENESAKFRLQVLLFHAAHQLPR